MKGLIYSEKPGDEFLAVLTDRQTNKLTSSVTSLCYSVVQWKTLGSKIPIVNFKSENGAMVVRRLWRKA